MPRSCHAAERAKGYARLRTQMGVRADHTPQVARIDAHLLNEPGVTRLCYAGSVLRTVAPGLALAGQPDARTVAHVLDRIGFGARPGDVARVQQVGLAAYIPLSRAWAAASSAL